MSGVPGAYVFDDESMDETTDADSEFRPRTEDGESDDEDMREFLAAAAEEMAAEVGSRAEMEENAAGEQNEGAAAGAEGGGGGVRIGIDRSTGQLIFLDGTGAPMVLGGAGRNFLQRLLNTSAVGGLLGGRRRTAMIDDDDDEGMLEEEEEAEDDEDDDDGEGFGGGLWGMGRLRPRSEFRYPVQKQPDPKGIELLRSGDFGRAPRYLQNLTSVRTSPRFSPTASTRRLSTASSRSTSLQSFSPIKRHTVTLHNRRSTNLITFLRQSDSLPPLHRSMRWGGRLPFGGGDSFQGRPRAGLGGGRNFVGAGLEGAAGGVAMGGGDDWGPGIGVPNSDGTEVATFGSRIYSGQYSDDGGFFYTASQAFKIYIYDMTAPPNVLPSKSTSDTTSAPTTYAPTDDDDDDDEGVGFRRWNWGFGRGPSSFTHRSSLTLSRTFQARERDCRWTVTDAALSPCNSWLVYSSITPVVHLVKTRGQDAVMGLGLEDHEQERLDFDRGAEGFGIWSLRFDAEGRQIAAGCSHGVLTVYDVERKEPVVSVRGHGDDVNAVCFADRHDPNILVSGADDSLLKIWDRRALRSGAAGVLVGHTEGVTYVESKGDGRYVLSNGKDQGAKLWDLRSMVTGSEYARSEKINVGIRGWDYRANFYQKPVYAKHPQDRAVVTYRGHSVLQTLIRAHISPPSTTGQRFIYSGSADGKIHIWHLDGRIAQVLDRSHSRPLLPPKSVDGGGAYNDPSMPMIPAETAGNKRRHISGVTVRDVSWHPYEPTLISTGWGGSGGAEGSLAMHHWLGHGKRVEPDDCDARSS